MTQPWIVGRVARRIGVERASGCEAVEILRTDHTEPRIGTDDPQGLVRALASAAGERPTASESAPGQRPGMRQTRPEHRAITGFHSGRQGV